MKTKYRIGTRGSLLALTQAGQVLKELERKSDASFELVIIKTEGDQKTDLPLWQMSGANYFTKELDHALLHDEIDLVVHSYKDLSYERPQEIAIAAITKRDYPHDLFLIKKNTVEKLKKGELKELVVGTSSPRRIYNLEKSLSTYLPNGADLRIKTKTLRGNVNTRIEKVKTSDYDAIVLALAGVERLSLLDKNLPLLKELVSDLTYMVLPLSVFPSAAAQGALAIETKKNRSDNGVLFKIIEKLHDEKTAQEVSFERKAFHNYGGGCHLAVGINTRVTKHGILHNHMGYFNDDIQKHEFVTAQELPSLKYPLFTGMIDDSGSDTVTDNYFKKIEYAKQQIPYDGDVYYFTSKYTLLNINGIQNKIIATSGTSLLKKCAQENIFVNLTADSLSEEETIHLLQSNFLKLFNPNKKIYVLSHNKATTKIGTIVPTYTHEINKNISSDFLESVKKCETFFWTSVHQYDAYSNLLDLSKKVHCTGPGKTADQLQERGLILGKNLFIFMNLSDLKNRMNS